MSKGTRVHTLLFVDDEEAVLQSLKRACRNAGWHIMTALSGHEGLSLMKTAEIDLVVSDMRMPEMDGATFLERVKKSSPKTNSRELSEQVITKLRRFQRETDGLLRICVFN